MNGLWRHPDVWRCCGKVALALVSLSQCAVTGCAGGALHSPGGDSDRTVVYDLAGRDMVSSFDAEIEQAAEALEIETAPSDYLSWDGPVEEAPEVAMPPEAVVTVNAIPDSMNGKRPYTTTDGNKSGTFTLRVPTGGFSVDVYLPDDWDGPDQPWSVSLKSSSPLVMGNQELPPDTELADALQCAKEKDPVGWPQEQRLVARCWVPRGALEPADAVAFTARLRAQDGAWGPEDSITVDVVEMPDYLDPFPETDVWLVVLDRDMFEHVIVENPDGTLAIDSLYKPGGNGTPDLDEILYAVGFLSDNQDFSAQAKALFIGNLRRHAYRMFQLDESGGPTPNGPNMRLYFQGDPGAPRKEDFGPSSGFSMIAVGSDPDAAGLSEGLFGWAYLDWNNQSTEDLTQYGYGVFVTNILRKALGTELGAALFSEILPSTGTPLGMYPGDELFLEPDFDPESVSDERLKLRYSIFDAIVHMGTMAIAAVLCHEIGHSVGLVPDGPPPLGLFGGMSGLSFTVSDPGSAHVDTPGLNIMQTGKVTSFMDVFSDYPRFNELNMAYLRRRLVVGKL